MWEYLKNSGAIALLRNSHGITILYVYEARDHYIAEPCFPGPHLIRISYSSTRDEEAEKGLSTDEVRDRRLKVACKLIEEKYEEQIDSMLSVIG